MVDEETIPGVIVVCDAFHILMITKRTEQLPH